MIDLAGVFRLYAATVIVVLAIGLLVELFYQRRERRRHV